MNITHKMKLRNEPFERILSGEKTIEYRLNDEKRKLLRKGDFICFTEMEDGERTLTVEIIDIITAPSFAALRQKLTQTGLADKTFKPIDMRKYYSAEEEQKYGVVGIKIKVVGMDE